ncbi:MAG TPA: lipid-A-disaccharide synthase, partial [Candidatus Obscuribacterales bacterium]
FAAGLLLVLKARCPGLRAYGLGGPQLQAAGLCLLADVRARAAVGLSENLSGLPYFWALHRQLRGWLRQVRPQAVLLVDFQGFNLQLAATAKSLGIPVIYFVAPQDWLWGFAAGVRRIVASVDLLLAVFEPEAEFYRGKGAQVVHTGHPLLDMLPQLSREQARHRLGLPQTERVVCWMPGSRTGEVARLLPVLKQVQAALPPGWTHLLPQAAGFLATDPAAFPALRLPAERRYDAMLAADAVIGASGSMVLEAALLARPVVALYKVSGLTYAVARRLVRLPWITLPNLLLQQPLVPEYIQDLPPDAIAAALISQMQDPEKWQEAALTLASRLGPPGAWQRAAEAVLDFLEAKPGLTAMP